MQKAVSGFVESGKPVIAECGGMMYLGKGIVGENGMDEEMCGIFNFSATFQSKKLHLGYRQINLGDFTLKGHEFHYSHLIRNEEGAPGLSVKNARGITVDMPVFSYKNCWASYMHLYLGEEGKLEQFINFIMQRNETSE
jgi:cobyrinic acid a,c-diamide synthase